MTMPPTLSSASNDDLLFGVPAPAPLSPNPAKQESKEIDDDKDSSEQGGGVIKANKGMILRKSVEYIRWVSVLLCIFRVRGRGAAF